MTRAGRLPDSDADPWSQEGGSRTATCSTTGSTPASCPTAAQVSSWTRWWNPCPRRLVELRRTRAHELGRWTNFPSIARCLRRFGIEGAASASSRDCVCNRLLPFACRSVRYGAARTRRRSPRKIAAARSCRSLRRRHYTHRDPSQIEPRLNSSGSANHRQLLGRRSGAGFSVDRYANARGHHHRNDEGQ